MKTLYSETVLGLHDQWNNFIKNLFANEPHYFLENSRFDKQLEFFFFIIIMKYHSSIVMYHTDIKNIKPKL